MCWFGSPSSRISVLWNLTVGIECGNMGSENGSYPKLGVYFSIGVPQTTGFPIRKITHFGWLWGPTLPAQCLQADLRGKVDPEVDFVGGSGFLIKGWGILSFFFLETWGLIWKIFILVMGWNLGFLSSKHDDHDGPAGNVRRKPTNMWI